MHRVLFLSAKPTADRPAAPQSLARVTSTAGLIIAALVAMRADAADGGAANFRVQGVTTARAAEIVEHAEQVRARAFAELLEIAAPQPWRVRCEIHVHATPASFAAAVGGPPAAARGATSIEFGAEDVLLRRIDVMGDGSATVPDALAHEIVHVVLADHFSDAPPPRWADEGLATLFDSPEKQRQHEADFRAGLDRGLAWQPRDLVALEHYPADTRRQRIFYGQSAAIARWLVARRDAATFVRFLDDCASQGTEAALVAHYGIASIADLAAAWHDDAAITLAAIGSPRP